MRLGVLLGNIKQAFTACREGLSDRYAMQQEQANKGLLIQQYHLARFTLADTAALVHLTETAINVGRKLPDECFTPTELSNGMTDKQKYQTYLDRWYRTLRLLRALEQELGLDLTTVSNQFPQAH